MTSKDFPWLQDPEYRRLRSEADRIHRDVSIANPALGITVDRLEAIYDEMRMIAVSYGWRDASEVAQA